MPYRLDNLPASCMPDQCFCENIRDEIPVQFSNTYSSFFFIIISFIIIYRYFRYRGKNSDSHFVFLQNPAYLSIYCISIFLIGFGSVYFHATLSFWGQFFDVSGMNFLGSFILLYHYKRVLGLKHFIKSYIVVNLILMSFLYYIPSIRRYLFAILLIISISILYINSVQFKFLLRLVKNERSLPQGFLMEGKSSLESIFPTVLMNKKYLYTSIALVIIATIIWILDITKVLCYPTSIIQGHSLWHFLCSLSTYYLYLFYESEKHRSATQ